MSIFEKAEHSCCPASSANPVEMRWQSRHDADCCKGAQPRDVCRAIPQTHLVLAITCASPRATSFTVVFDGYSEAAANPINLPIIEGQNAYTKREWPAEQLSVMHALGP